MSNFLGEVKGVLKPTSILSGTELIEREGVDLKKGMNFRKDVWMTSVFLVLPSHDGEYKDAWDEDTEMYTFEGHDSTTIEAGGKSKDQLLMYADGRFTDNGKFYKAANEFKDRLRKEPMRIQVYEKLDAGAWFDKGIFDLVDARKAKEDGRVLIKFDLQPVGEGQDDAIFTERMLSVVAKAEVWKRDNGRCSKCKAQTGLRFIEEKKKHTVHLLCAKCRGESGGLL